MANATGRLLGWDDRDSLDGATFDGLDEYVYGVFSEMELTGFGGKTHKRTFIGPYEVEPDSVVFD